MNNQKKAHKEDTPLVSIIVITYNSARFVLETLESAKAQTYENIELIVSDDASTDDTVEVCRKWLDENKERFVRTELITVPENTGIPANCNRGLRAAKGEGVKYIAGDDALMEDCVEKKVLAVLSDHQIKILFSYLNEYLETFEDKTYIGKRPVNEKPQFFNEKITAREQYELLLLKDEIGFTPSAFFSKKAIEHVGGFDERFKLIEDYPMWLNLTQRGYKLFFKPFISIRYRRHQNATHNLSQNFIKKPSYFRNEKMRRVYVYPHITRFHFLHKTYVYYVSLVFHLLRLNRRNKLLFVLYRAITKYLNVFFLAEQFSSKLFKYNIRRVKNAR